MQGSAQRATSVGTPSGAAPPLLADPRGCIDPAAAQRCNSANVQPPAAHAPLRARPWSRGRAAAAGPAAQARPRPRSLLAACRMRRGALKCRKGGKGGRAWGVAGSSCRQPGGCPCHALACRSRPRSLESDKCIHPLTILRPAGGTRRLQAASTQRRGGCAHPWAAAGLETAGGRHPPPRLERAGAGAGRRARQPAARRATRSCLQACMIGMWVVGCASVGWAMRRHPARQQRCRRQHGLPARGPLTRSRHCPCTSNSNAACTRS